VSDRQVTDWSRIEVCADPLFTEDSSSVSRVGSAGRGGVASGELVVVSVDVALVEDRLAPFAMRIIGLRREESEGWLVRPLLLLLLLLLRLHFDDGLDEMAHTRGWWTSREQRGMDFFRLSYFSRFSSQNGVSVDDSETPL